MNVNQGVLSEVTLLFFSYKVLARACTSTSLVSQNMSRLPTLWKLPELNDIFTKVCQLETPCVKVLALIIWETVSVYSKQALEKVDFSQLSGLFMKKIV